MNYFFKNGIITMTKYNSFDIEEILECGQCFRFSKLGEKEYLITAYGKTLRIKQYKNDKIEFFPTTEEDFNNIWINYFDLKTDYSEIKNILSAKDDILKEAIAFADGIRILNQEPWECLISFIISQNNRIPMIKQVIKNLSEKYGKKAGENFAFPTLYELSAANEEELMLCKTGFRAKYILDAINKLNNGTVSIEKINTLSTSEAKEELLKIKGVGDKVSDCVLLFSFGRRETFPTDVWVKRVMEHFYFNGNNTNIKAIHQTAEEKFGKLAGYAQQYLFHYARQLKIGAK